MPVNWLQNHETDGSQDHWLQAPVRADEIAERGLAVGAEGRADRRRAGRSRRFRRRRSSPTPRPPRPCVPAPPDNGATRGDGEREHSVDQSGHAHAQEHPLPGHHGAHHRAGAAADVHEQRVDQQGDEDCRARCRSCCSEAEHATLPGRDVSVIYIGATTGATPAANPPNTRNAARISMFGAESAQPIPHTRKQTAAIFIIGTRPTLLGGAPGRQRADAPGDQAPNRAAAAKRGVAGVKMFLDDRGGVHRDDGGVVTVEQIPPSAALAARRGTILRVCMMGSFFVEDEMGGGGPGLCENARQGRNRRMRDCGITVPAAPQGIAARRRTVRTRTRRPRPRAGVRSESRSLAAGRRGTLRRTNTPAPTVSTTSTFGVGRIEVSSRPITML